MGTMTNTSQLMWSPRPKEENATFMDHFRDAVNKKYNLSLKTYEDLYAWSVDEHDVFWQEVWTFCDILHSVPWNQVIDKKEPMENIPKWFSGTKLNYAENLLRYKDDKIALYAVREGGKCVHKRTFAELNHRVAMYAAAMKKLGIGVGNVVAGYISNGCEAIEAMLAAASIGAIWTSTSPDFGITGVLDRFAQVKPKIMFSVDSATYNGKNHDHLEKLHHVVKYLPSLEKVIVISNQQSSAPLDDTKYISLADFLNLGLDDNGAVSQLHFQQLPFDHPLFIMFSSGTTGVPKCIVHSAGGTLIKHLTEHKLHGNISRSDLMMYFTTTGWMMWNWMVTCLALGASLVLYDGSPLYPHPGIMWDIVDELGVTILGTGAKWLAVLESKGIKPRETHQLKHLHTILSTGSPLASHSYDYVYRDIKSDVLLASISGGTDIIGCFVGWNASVPVYRGEIQSRLLGMAVQSWNDEGKSVMNKSGELVCIKPFPSMPTHFLNDANNLKYHAAYFEKYPSVWCHGDYCLINSQTGTVIMLGRSDGTLNPNGVRFGSAEIYNIVEQFKEVQDSVCVAQMNASGEERVVLFLKMVPGVKFSTDLVKQLQNCIRKQLSARHVPAVILPIADIPYTTNGKKVEMAVKRIIAGKMVENRNSLSNPEALDLYKDISELKDF